MILQHRARQHLYHGLAGSDEPAAVFAKTSVFDQVQSLCDHETGPNLPAGLEVCWQCVVSNDHQTFLEV